MKTSIIQIFLSQLKEKKKLRAFDKVKKKDRFWRISHRHTYKNNDNNQISKSIYSTHPNHSMQIMKEESIFLAKVENLPL